MLQTQPHPPAPASPTPYLWKALLDGGFINSVGISGNGQVIVGGTYFYNTAAPKTAPVGMYAYDQAGTRIWSDVFNATGGAGYPSAGVDNVAVSRDGAWAIGGGQSGQNTGFVKIYNAASGASALNWTGTTTNVRAVAINTDGSVAAAGADALYVFTRTGSTAAPTWTAQKQDTAGRLVEEVAVSGDGKWIVAALAADATTGHGTIRLFKNIAGTLTEPFTAWSTPVKSYLLSVAFAADVPAFAAASSTDCTTYYFHIATPTSPSNPPLKPTWHFKLPGCSSCRFVAVSDDGKLVAASGTASSSSSPADSGLVFRFGKSGTGLWKSPVSRSTNSTSMDSVGRYVAVSDGLAKNPAGSAFYIFDSTGGTPPVQAATNVTNYSMQIAASGNSAIGGSDDGNLYYFTVT